jgi:hypothetical protein
MRTFSATKNDASTLMLDRTCYVSSRFFVVKSEKCFYSPMIGSYLKTQISQIKCINNTFYLIYLCKSW